MIIIGNLLEGGLWSLCGLLLSSTMESINRPDAALLLRQPFKTSHNWGFYKCVSFVSDSDVTRSISRAVITSESWGLVKHKTSQELQKLPSSHKLPGKSSLNVSFAFPVLSCPVLSTIFTMKTMTMATMMATATMRKLEVIWGSWRLYTRKLEVVWSHITSGLLV